MSDDVKVGLVRLDQITFHPHNTRVNLGDLRSLSESIRKFGVMQPVVVEQRGRGLRLRAGHRRVAAARIAGLARIPAVIHAEALETDEWIIASVQENEQRKQLAQDDRLRAVQALLDLGCSRDGIADAFSVARGTIDNWLNPDRAKDRTRQRRKRVLYPGNLRKLVAKWRADGTDLDTILAELDQLCTGPTP